MPRPKLPRDEEGNIIHDDKRVVEETISEFTKATVYAKDGGIHRVYDLETHGKNFADLAKEFASHTHGSRVVLS